MTMLSVIMAYRRNNPGTWSAVEIETFTLACMASAVDDAINAVHNVIGVDLNALRVAVDVNQLLEEYREDFESKAIDFAVGERSAPIVKEHKSMIERQSVGRGLRVPEPVEVIPMVSFSDAMAQRKRDLMQPAPMPLGHPVVVATTDKDQDGNAVERLVHMTTEEIEAANFKAFDPDKFVKPDDHFDAVQDAIYGEDEPDERPSATDIINDADPR